MWTFYSCHSAALATPREKALCHFMGLQRGMYIIICLVWKFSNDQSPGDYDPDCQCGGIYS